MRIETELRSSQFLRKVIPAETWYKTHDAELLPLFRRQDLEALFRRLQAEIRSFKPDHSALLRSESIIFTSRAIELLMFCLVTISDSIIARTRQMQLQMPCLVILRESPTKELWGLTLSSFLSTSSSLTLRVPLFWASPCRLSTLLRPCSHCTRSLFAEHSSYLSHISELADGPTKPVLGTQGWGCQGQWKKTIRARELGRRKPGLETQEEDNQSRLDNQDRTSWMRKLGRLRWGLTLSRP